MTRLVRVIRPVRSLAIAQAFYCEALGFVPVAAGGPGRVLLQAGDQQALELVETVVDAAPVPATSLDLGSTDPRFQHIALVTADMAASVARLRHHAPALVNISHDGPQALAGAAAGITAFKFRDPDGHPVELLAFAPAVLPPVWQGKTAPKGAVLGLDHAALSVRDPARSIAFYRDRLGLRLAASQVNQGPAQARLDGLAMAEVEVVTLHPTQQATLHLELLGYRGLPVDRPVPPRHPLADVLVLAVAHGGDGAALPQPIDDPDGHRWRWVR